ncbi:winged helix-turn-helix transcriptional regulator [Streptomyces sp. NPDC059169]|uniref:winged helix-turn-helix transcriptional regulator n=1 Tax=Streptomyces sp. NPDC059169 TaxID=3346754 RepID=UPI0036A544AB
MATTGLPPAVDADVSRVTEVLGMITPRWNVQVLLALSVRPLRYTEIANKLSWLHSGQLHPKLRSLCEDGLVERTEHSVRHVTYGLTARGTALLPVLPVIAAWGKEFLEEPDTPLSAIEHVEDSLTLLTRRHAPAILWALKSRDETSARALASIVMPGGLWTNIYPPLRQLTADALVVTAPGRPYRLSESGNALDAVFASLSAWAAGRPLAHASRHPIWGQADGDTPTAPQTWVSAQSRLPAPTVVPAPAGATRPTWHNRDLFSHATPARPQVALRAGGVRR